MTFRAYQDNVLVLLDPPPRRSAGGIHLPDQRRTGARDSRTATVVASGRGYYTRMGAFVENTVREGERVLLDSLAGQKYDFDLTAPRHHDMAQDFGSIDEVQGEFRVVREGEILGVIE